MKYLAALLISLLTMIGLRQLAQAETNVNVYNSTSGGSNTHVVVNSNVNTSNVTTTNTNSRTTVHIENNGEVKDFDTNGDESVDWQSNDGKSSVKINNNSAKVQSNSTQKITTTPTVTPKPTSDEDGDDDREATHSTTIAPKKMSVNHSFISSLLSWIANFFK